MAQAKLTIGELEAGYPLYCNCLLYTSDAADE